MLQYSISKSRNGYFVSIRIRPLGTDEHDGGGMPSDDIVVGKTLVEVAEELRKDFEDKE